MNHRTFGRAAWRRVPLWTALILLCLLWTTSCQAPADSPTTDAPPTEALTLAPEAPTEAPESGALTLAPTDTAEPPVEDMLPLPGPGALRDDVDYEALVISAYYAAGHLAGEAHAEASFVELANPTDKDIPLAGVSLYVASIDGAFTEYGFPEGDVVPADGRFLIRGMDANGESRGTLTVAVYDRRFATLSPNEKGARLVLAPAETDLPADKALDEVEGLFAYVTSAPADAADVLHYVSDPSVNKVIRKKAANDGTDYRTYNLNRTAASTLALIRPQTSKGDVNTTVKPAIAEVVFSHPSGIYAEAFDLTLSAPEGYEVYYTINDTDPRGAMSATYRKPLHISDTSDMSWGKLTVQAGTYMGTTYDPLAASFPGALVVKAFAKRISDGAVTSLSTRTYFVGKVFSDWGIDLVSLSLDSQVFLGSKGIYNNIKQGVGIVREHAPAYVEFISPEGQAVHAGWCEIAMNGKGSLGMTQKSFRILLKSQVMNSPDIGENPSTMDYDIFGEYASRKPDGTPVDHFRHILLRNGGGDMSGSTISRSHIGDAYIQRIDRFLNPDVMAYAPTMVFVNGEFWGMYNARERLDDKHFEAKYGIPEEDLALVECPYPLFYGWNVPYTDGLDDPTEIADAQEFMDLVNFCQSNNMADAANYQYVADRLDIDGLIDFYCAQIYLNCSDWPSNNIKVWRNKNPDNPNVDTRWHFCIVDTDHGVGLNSTVDQSLWGVISDGPVISRIINHLLQNPQFRERFRMRYVWCIEVYFAPDRLTAELDALVEPLLPVMQYQLDRWRCTNGERTDWEKWYSYIEVIRDYVTRRPAYAKTQFMQWCGGLTENGYQSLKQKAIAEWGSKVGA